MRVVEGLTGYKTNVRSLIPLTLITLLSGGIVWIAAQHNYPQIVTWFMKESSLQEAHYVLAKVPSVVLSSACGCTYSECLVVFAPAHQQALHHQQGTPSQPVCKTGVCSSTLCLLSSYHK